MENATLISMKQGINMTLSNQINNVSSISTVIYQGYPPWKLQEYLP